MPAKVKWTRFIPLYANECEIDTLSGGLSYGKCRSAAYKFETNKAGGFVTERVGTGWELCYFGRCWRQFEEFFFLPGYPDETYVIAQSKRQATEYVELFLESLD